uniref:Uncharacterized protein n=1 Tax=viral metagenome TaxID=1070528 RepID=A0A6C0KGV8_9ZZZZ
MTKELHHIFGAIEDFERVDGPVVIFKLQVGIYPRHGFPVFRQEFLDGNVDHVFFVP